MSADAGIGPKPFPATPPGIAVRAAFAVHQWIRRATDRVVPADLLAYELISGALITTLLGAAARHRVFDLLIERPQTGAEIAARIGADRDATHRMLRGLALVRVVRLGSDGRFHATRVARALASDRLSRMREIAASAAAAGELRALAEFAHTLATGTSAFARANGIGVWEWYDADPIERELFAEAMMGMTIHAAPMIAKLYPFSELAIVCDVGGGRGALLSELLVRHPHLRGVLCDRLGVLESAPSLLAARGVGDRVTLAPGNFLDRVPPGADGYVLKHVLNDWDDAHATQILGVIRRAMVPGQKLLVCEPLIEHSEVSYTALADVHMMAICGGRERSLADFHRLFAASGFVPARVYRYPTISIVEASAA